jgi:GDP-L-fucose synthase
MKQPFNLNAQKVILTGGNGFLGKAVAQILRDRGAQVIAPTHQACDLLDPAQCTQLVQSADFIIHLAAKVGGIGFNQENPGALFYENLMMGVQLMEAARKRGNIKQFLTVGTICAYPKFTPTPFKEEDLWIGYPEETNAPYGIAKKALLVMGQAYEAQYQFPARYVLPVNLYGPGDNFNPQSSHVIPALIKKIYDAKQEGLSEIISWGDGSPTREFLYVTDAAQGIVKALEGLDTSEPVNLGTGLEISIKDLVELIAELMDFKGEIRWDTSKPNGQPRRCLSVDRARSLLDWQAKVDFREGLRRTIAYYQTERSEH